MKWTQKDPDVRDVKEGELWCGVMTIPRPHVALVTRKGEDIRIHRFRPEDARDMGRQLISFADQASREANN